MNRFIMKNAPPPSTKKSAQTNTRTTAKNGAAKNRATQLELNVGEPLETTNKGVSISIDELSIDGIKKLTKNNALKLCQFHKISNATSNARMAKNMITIVENYVILKLCVSLNMTNWN